MIPGSAFACINGSELPKREREFRFQYLTPQMTSNEGPASAAENGLLALNLSGGVMLMYAAGVSE